MGRIRIDVDSLRGYAASLSGKVNEFEQLNQNMQALNDSIQSSWQGDAKNAYVAVTNGYYIKQQKMEKILIEFQRYAQETAERFEALDQTSAARIRSSF